MISEAQYNQFRSERWRDTWHHLPFFKEIAGGTILEIGTHAGASTCAFLYGLDEKESGHLYSVDIDAKSPAIVSLAGHPRWTFILGDSKDLRILPPAVLAGVDILFVDGDHSYEGASADLNNLFTLVRPGGLLLMHDVGEVPPNTPGTPFLGVRKAFQELRERYTNNVSYIFPESWGLGVMEVS